MKNYFKTDIKQDVLINEDLTEFSVSTKAFFTCESSKIPHKSCSSFTVIVIKPFLGLGEKETWILKDRMDNLR